MPQNGKIDFSGKFCPIIDFVFGYYCVSTSKRAYSCLFRTFRALPLGSFSPLLWNLGDNSDQFHTGSERIANDSKRRNALAMLGIRVVSVTRLQLYNSVELERVARTIASYLDKRLKIKYSNFAAAHRELRRQLL